MRRVSCASELAGRNRCCAECKLPLQCAARIAPISRLEVLGGRRGHLILPQAVALHQSRARTRRAQSILRRMQTAGAVRCAYFPPRDSTSWADTGGTSFSRTPWHSTNPVRAAEQRSGGGGSRASLFERSEFAKPARRREQRREFGRQVHRRTNGEPGSPSLGYFSWRGKRSNSSAGRNRQRRLCFGPDNSDAEPPPCPPPRKGREYVLRLRCATPVLSEAEGLSTNGNWLAWRQDGMALSEHAMPQGASHGPRKPTCPQNANPCGSQRCRSRRFSSRTAPAPLPPNAP